MKLECIKAEFMFLGWSETHNGGAKVTFQVSSEELEPFKAMTARKGKLAGQRLMAVLVEIGPDEQPVPQESPATPQEAKARASKGFSPEVGPLAQLAVKWCNDQKFQEWVCEEYGDVADMLVDIKVMATPSQLAKEIVCHLCGVGSRKELDHNEDARAEFDKMFRTPYSKVAA